MRLTALQLRVFTEQEVLQGCVKHLTFRFHKKKKKNIQASRHTCKHMEEVCEFKRNNMAAVSMVNICPVVIINTE